MAKGTTVFGQVVHLIPHELFDNLATRFKVNRGVRFFKADAHFAALLLAQLAGLGSLRAIEQATAVLGPARRNGGLRPVRRSTLADANRRIPWRFYQALFFALLALWKREVGRHDFRLPGRLFSLDSTTIPLCLATFPWARYQTRKGALKLHTLLDHDDFVPEAVVTTDGKVSDIRVGRAIRFLPGETVLFDRGYFDSAWFDRLIEDGCFFVTRMKKNVAFAWTERRPVPPGTGVLADWIGGFTGWAGARCPRPLRLVTYKDPETKRTFEFLTNLLDLDAQEIADLYKQRWQIELFFKWIKQHLKIKAFLGTDENAVMSQIWVAMIAYLLLTVLAKRSKSDISVFQLLMFITVRTLQETPISKAWQGIQRTKRTPKQEPVVQTRNSA
jgi:putative transposase